MNPTNLRYHEEHEWIRVEGKQATLGISHFAQDALGDIVFIDMPKPGTKVTAGGQIGEIESTKTTSALYTPVSGTIVQGKAALKNHPGGLDTDPFPQGWVAGIPLVDPAPVREFMMASPSQK